MQVKLVCFAINLKISRNIWEIIGAHLSDYFDYTKWGEETPPLPHTFMAPFPRQGILDYIGLEKARPKH